jgi:hypothetical protein
MAANSTLCAKHGGRCRWRWRGSRGGCRTKFGSSGIHIGQSTGNGILENGATDLTVPFTLDTFWNSGDRRHCHRCCSRSFTIQHRVSCQHGTISINDAKAKLWEALGENSFQATGVSTDTGERTIIPDYAWRDLNDIEERGRDVLRLRESSGVWTHRGYHDVALRRQNIMAIWQPHRLDERGFRLPPLVKPEGSGYMPLYLAAQWIATRGGTVEIDPRDIVIWKDAFAMLLARMASEEVAVVGIRNGANEKIDGRLFAGIQVDYPFTDTSFSLLVSEELFLYSCPYLDDDHWRNGFDDRLESKNGVKWSRLMVLKSDIARWWPFDIASPTEVATLVGRTGAPGRPTSMHLVEVEHRARWQRGEAETSIGAEAAALSDWLQRAHPHAPRLKPKTIANRLRGEHRRLTADARK